MTHQSVCAAKVVEPDQGKQYWVLSERARILADANCTGGRLAAMETHVLPGGGPPAHERESELFYVLDGEFEFLHDEKTIRAAAGTCLYLPRGSTHTFKNV